MQKIGIIIGLVVGIILFLLPEASTSAISFNPKEKVVATTNDYKMLTPNELADWIISGRVDYQLIDIRDSKNYDINSIENSENIPAEKLMSKACIENDLSEDKLIVLYSKDNSLALNVLRALNLQGKKNVAILEGGFDNWNKVIMNPVKFSDEATDEEILAYRRCNAIANRFGGGNLEAGSDAPVKKKKKKKVKKGKKKKKKLGGC